MSEINDQGFEAQVAAAESQHEPTGPEPTGNAKVDAVLESLSGLESAPISEHVRVFESAHEELRSALTDAGNDDRPS